MRILFVRLSSFGDVVFALPAAKALRTLSPARISRGRSSRRSRLSWRERPTWTRSFRSTREGGGARGALRRPGRIFAVSGKVRGKSNGASAAGSPFDLVIDARGCSSRLSSPSPLLRRRGKPVRLADRHGADQLPRHGRAVDVDRASRPHVADQMLALAERVTGKTDSRGRRISNTSSKGRPRRRRMAGAVPVDVPSRCYSLFLRS